MTTHNEFVEDYGPLCMDAGNLLIREGIKLFHKMTADEQQMIVAKGQHGRGNWLLAKAILCAVANTDLVERAFGAETINKDVKRLRKIYKERQV